MNAENTKNAVARLGSCLNALHEEAKRTHAAGVTLPRLNEALAVSTSALGAWLNGQSAPSRRRLPKYRELIAYLEERAKGPRRTSAEWDLLIKAAMDESHGKRGGRPPKTSRPARVAPFRYCHTAAAYMPQVLTGREAELEQLQTLIGTGSPYLVLVAPPWAGKTALLATFVTSRATDDVDLVAYFVRRKHGTDTAEAFLGTMVEQLSLHVGKRRGRPDRATLLALYEEAARTSITRGRNLLLIVDGLDEDARQDNAGNSGGESIASLLPPQPHPGLRVLVSHRWHPPLPGDVPMDHPLRRAEQMPGFRSSPHAGVLRSTALDDLSALFRDSRGWVSEVVGFLALASGGLSHKDLSQLAGAGGPVPTLIPYNVQDLLHSVAGRVLGPEDLEPDTFVLAHEELYKAATESLDPDMLAELTQRLHAWADRYRAQGWPESTPPYLLHGYHELLANGGDLDRLTTFAIDHRRLLRLTDRGRPDVALACLDHITQTTPTPAVLASAAASRSLLEAQSRLVPREVLHALGVVGDIARARSLALSPSDAASKAVRLLEVVQALISVRSAKAADQAAGLAREAAAWAEQAQQHNTVTEAVAELDSEAIVPRAAVALAATGQPAAAIRMLTTIDICRPDHVSAVAQAAALLLGTDPAFAGRLLDELTAEAEDQAESAEGTAFALEIWAAVAAADPERAEPIHRRMLQFNPEVNKESSDPAARRAQRNRAGISRSARNARGVMPPREPSTPSAEVAHQLLAAGESPEKVHALLAEAEETEKLLKEIERLSDLGNGPQLRWHLEQFTMRTVKRSAAAPWLPFLAQALSSTRDATGNDLLSALEAELSDTPLHVQVLTSAALAHADAGRRGQALQYTKKAAAITQRMTAPQPQALLVAQAFAHAGDGEQATHWASRFHGHRPTGRAGILYRRTALALDMGLNPKATSTRILTDNVPQIRLSSSGTSLLQVLRDRAAGAHTDAQIASLQTTARARLRTEPSITTGLALLHATLGDTKHACDTAAALPDPTARGTAQATLATYLAGIPTYLDVTADEDHWTLSLLQTLAHHTHPPQLDQTPTVHNLLHQTLNTPSWHQALPVLARTHPTALHTVTDTLNQHQQLQSHT
ncbi:hypothetical protein [Streptomyces sp. NPDC001530]|uniref:hypothetical protein n=1 Tax=Streptomyces sp. NPDC001530 TaxID=3364582 RepID=UPI003685FA79